MNSSSGSHFSLIIYSSGFAFGWYECGLPGSWGSSSVELGLVGSGHVCLGLGGVWSGLVGSVTSGL